MQQEVIPEKPRHFINLMAVPIKSTYLWIGEHAKRQLYREDDNN